MGVEPDGIYYQAQVCMNIDNNSAFVSPASTMLLVIHLLPADVIWRGDLEAIGAGHTKM